MKRPPTPEGFIYCCRWCGPNEGSHGNWCDTGCGRDYNEMKLIPLSDSDDWKKHFTLSALDNKGAR